MCAEVHIPTGAYTEDTRGHGCLHLLLSVFPTGTLNPESVILSLFFPALGSQVYRVMPGLLGLTQGLSVYPWLAQDSPCRPD